MYRFFDSDGHLIVLRSDITAPIGRVISYVNLELPVKLSYSGKIFRTGEEMSGQQNEITQAGIELVGFPSLKAEVETLNCAYQILTALDIPDFHFEIGHADIYNALISSFSLDPFGEHTFKEYLLSKNISGLKSFVAENPGEFDAFIKELPYLYGNAPKVLAKAKDLLPNDTRILNAFSQMEELISKVKRIVGETELTVDLGMVPAMNYYTGLMFNGFADKVADTFLSGGRYDKLVQRGDKKVVPAAGMALNLDVLVNLKHKLGTLEPMKTASALIHYEWSDLMLAEKLYQETKQTQLSIFDALDEALEFAAHWSFEEVWYVNNGKVEVFNMREGDGKSLNDSTN
jgi:ATP phosphoribosyltransferase regulatory subunit